MLCCGLPRRGLRGRLQGGGERVRTAGTLDDWRREIAAYAVVMPLIARRLSSSSTAISSGKFAPGRGSISFSITSSMNS